jgi:hypothetical protein
LRFRICVYDRRGCVWLRRRLRWPRLSPAENSVATKIIIQRQTRRTLASACRSIRNMDHRHSASTTTATRQIFTLRIAVDHSACNSFVNSPATTVGITPISTRHMRHTTPVVVIVPSSITISIVITITIAISVMTITTRMWISLVIIQRIPADVIAKRKVD